MRLPPALRSRLSGDSALPRFPSWDELQQLSPEDRRRVVEYFRRLSDARKSGEVNFLRPDGKSQVTVEYKNGKPVRIDAIVVSTQHADMPIEKLRDCALLIRHHHEHYDGTGYPDHLAGMAIPTGARILAVVNDYDALCVFFHGYSGRCAWASLRPTQKRFMFMQENWRLSSMPNCLSGMEEVTIPDKEF